MLSSKTFTYKECRTNFEVEFLHDNLSKDLYLEIDRFQSPSYVTKYFIKTEFITFLILFPFNGKMKCVTCKADEYESRCRSLCFVFVTHGLRC